MNKIDYFNTKLESTLSPVEYVNHVESHPDDYFLLDVRIAPPEGDFEKIADAAHIPLNELETRLDELPKEKTIIVYCWETFCNMGAAAAVTLLKNDFDVKELSGGIGAWKMMGFPIEK